MLSRKKAKGKARKAAKQASKASAKESQEVVATNQQEQEEVSLEAQMQLLQIINSQSQISCAHGCPELLLSSGDLRLCQDFINAFLTVAESFSEETGGIMDAFVAAHQATAEEFAEVYLSKLEVVVLILLCSGTQYILDENNRPAYIQAMLGCYFEEWIAVFVRKTKALIKWSKIFELDGADDHTLLVQYYRKRIPCSCLDKIYEEVKSVKKIGWCYNPNCSRPNQMAVRSKMFSCTRCGQANYCSIECQKANWNAHRAFWFCDRDMNAKAAFDSKKRI